MAKKLYTQSTAGERIARTEAYAENVRKMFNATVNEILELKKTLPKLDDGVMYSFDGDTVKVRNQVASLLKRLHASTTLAITKGIEAEWGIANKECDDLISQCFGQQLLESKMFRAWTDRNTNAMNAFINRTDAGMNLSDRVWKSCRQLRDEMEVALTVGIGSGQSASGMSRVVRQCLNDPDLMFRRFRYKKGEDAYGNPIWGRKWKKREIDPVTGKVHFIDYDKDSYIPKGAGGSSRGVYKSAYKNAMRVTRTETNMAYRRADHERWKQMSFVRGIRIELSNQHPDFDICDAMQGDYPKDFYFGGWHPHCFCYAIPLLVGEDEMKKVSEEFLKGNVYTPRGRQITSTPQNFKDWVSNNSQRIIGARSLPYWVKDNPLYVDAARGIALNPKVGVTRSAEEIMDIQNRWNQSRKVAAEVDKILATMPNAVPDWVGYLKSEIEACKTISEVDEVLFRKGVTKRSDYGKMALEDVKTVAKVAAEMHKRFELKSFVIKVEKSKGGTFMSANGSVVNINAKYWESANIKGTLRTQWYDCVSNWENAQRKYLQQYEDWAKQQTKMGDIFKAKGDDQLAKYYYKSAKKYERDANKLRAILDQGIKRHNVFLSRETMLRDCFTHEMGHVVHDQIMGGINGTILQRKRFQFGDKRTRATKLNNEVPIIFKQQKGDMGFLSKYGTTKSGEFVAESMVLYMYTPEKLPQNVHKWFEAAEELASGKAIVKMQKASRREAYELYKKQFDVNEIAKRRHAKRDEDAIRKRLEERNKAFRIAEKQANKVYAVAQKFPNDIDISRLTDLMQRRQYTRMGEEAKRLAKQIADIQKRERAMSDLLDAKKYRDTMTISSVEAQYANVKKRIGIIDKNCSSFVGQKAYIEQVLKSEKDAIAREMLENRLVFVNIKARIEVAMPEYTTLTMSNAMGEFANYKGFMDKAKNAIAMNDADLLEQMIKEAKEFDVVYKRYSAMKPHAKLNNNGKLNKIGVALNEAEAFMLKGDYANANIKIAEAEKTKAINDASNAAKKKQREEAKAKKAAEEAAKKAAQELSGKKKVDLSKLNYEDLVKELGDDLPRLMKKYEDAIARENLTDPIYLAERAEIEAKLKAFFEGVDFAHCVPSSLLDFEADYLEYGWRGSAQKGRGMYIDEGIPTNLEVNAVGAKVWGRPNWSLKDKDYDDGRRSWGHWAYGYQDSKYGDVPKKERFKDNEYYRCGTPVPKDDIQKAWDANKAGGYGDVQIILKRENFVTTWTYGNSLGRDTIPSLVSDPKVVSIDSRNFVHYKDAAYKDPSRMVSGSGASYIELQYIPKRGTGQILPSDMKSMTFSVHPELKLSKEALKKWHEHGVDIYYQDTNGKVVLYKKGKPQLTEAEALAKIEENRPEIDDWMKRLSQIETKDLSLTVLQEKLKNGEYVDAWSEFESAKNKMAALESKYQAVAKYIPNAKDLNKRFTIDEIEGAYTAIESKINWMTTQFRGRTDPEEVIKKWKFEMDYLKDPSAFRPGAKQHSTWEISYNAFRKERDALIDKYHRASLDDNISRINAFATKDKAFLAKRKEMQDLAKEGRWGEVEDLIDGQLKGDMIALQQASGEKVLKLGESSIIKFSSEDYDQARKDAAKWFKDPDIQKGFNEADAYMSKYAQDMWKMLTEEEKHIMWLYTDGSRYINEEMIGTYCLRKRSRIDGSIRNGLADANVITSIIEKAPALKDDMWMQSGKSEGAFKAIFGVDLKSTRDLSKIIGKEGTNTLFTSCHTAKHGAFTGDTNTGEDNNVVLSIFMPKGTKGAYMEPFASWGDAKRGTEGLNWKGTKRKCDASNQVEYLLQRGAKFKITKAEYKNGKWYIDVDLVEQTAVGALDTNISMFNYRSTT